MDSSLRILLLEDNPNDAELVKGTLADDEISCEITRVETGKTFTAALERERFDLILADYKLPRFSGLDALKLAKSLRPEIPFIFVSGTIGEEFAVLTLHMGATDYVLKNKLVRLPTAVRRAITEAEATATRIRMEESLRLHATRMKSILETSLDAIIVMDSQGVILDWNTRATAIFGWQKHEALGRTVAETIIPPQHREAHLRGLARFLATGEGSVLNRRIDITALHRTGREFPVELAITATRIHDQWQFTAFIADITERKRAEQGLKWFRTLLDNVTDSIEIIDPRTGKFLDGNEKAWSNLGYTRGELLTLTVSDIDPLVTSPAFAKLVRQLRETGEARVLESIHLRKDRTTFPVEVNAHCIRQDGQEFLVAIVRDITERKRTEEALRETEERFRSAFGHAAIGMALVSTDGRWLQVNPTLCDIVGYSEPELLATTFQAITHPDDLDTDLAYVRQMLAREIRYYQMEKRYIHKRGHVVWILLSVSLVHDREGNPLHFIGLIQDITERKQAENRLAAQYAVAQVLAESPALQEASAKILQVLCECLGWQVGSIWRVDRDANLLRCLEIWQTQKTEADEFMAISRQRTFASGVGMPGRVWSGGEPVWIPDVLKDRNFPRAPMAAKAGLHGAIGFPIKIGKNVYGIMEFFSCEIRELDAYLLPMVGDIGIKIGQFIERKEAEEALQERELAKLSAERANQAKSEFLSRMSHELRTPLNAVLGFAQLLEMEALSPEQQQHVQHIIKGGQHLLVLINEVLDIARIEAGHMTLSLEPVPVSVIIGEAVDLVRPQAAARNIQLITPAAREETYVRAEQQRLKQVLLNLLSNGVKYNRKGGTLTVSGQAVPEGRYRLTVTDTGGGMPPALLSRLFTPFDRLEADSSTEGTGLGLVLSRSLITAMGGTISVDSMVGQGTSFSVELLLSEHPVTPAATVSAKIPIAAPRSGGAFTVLYIEDNLSNYQLVERLVERRPGVKLLSAMQGKLGVELAVSHRPDLILLDLNLPDIQGDEVLLRLRERPETAGIPVVLLSADAMQKQIDKLLAAGAREYLTKPIDVVQFYAVLDKILMTKK